MVNKIKKDFYCSKKRPVKILELSNQFFPFLAEIDILDSLSDVIKIYFVENIVHFSNWMYENLHTKLKVNLSLISIKP